MTSQLHKTTIYQYSLEISAEDAAT